MDMHEHVKAENITKMIGRLTRMLQSTGHFPTKQLLSPEIRVEMHGDDVATFTQNSKLQQLCASSGFRIFHMDMEKELYDAVYLSKD